MEREVFARARLSNTRFDTGIPDGGHRALGHALNDGRIVRSESVHPSLLDGAGGIITTATDLMMFDRALMRGALLSSPSLLRLPPAGLFICVGRVARLGHRAVAAVA